MRVHVLGSASQAGLAVSADGRRWSLLGASPDLREQLAGFPFLWPREGRETAITRVILANGELDHVLGLLLLRETERFEVLATDAVTRGFCDGTVMARTLAHGRHVTWRPLELGVERLLGDGLAVTAFHVPGKAPGHLRRAALPGDNVILRVRDVASGSTLLHAPTVARPAPGLARLLAEADVIAFDGALWSRSELDGAAEPEHWPLGGPDGSLAILAGLRARRLLVHVSDTNPILDQHSPERFALRLAGVELAENGQEFES